MLILSTRNFEGAFPLDVYINARETDGLIDPEAFARIAEFEAWVEERPQVTQVLSVVDLVRKMYEEINPEMAAAEPLPATRQALAQLLLLFEMSGGQDLERTIDYEHTVTRLNARLPELGVIEVAELGREIERKGNELLGPDLIVETLSMDFLMGDWVDEIIAGQKRGLAFALVTIAVLMIISVRTFKVGLLSMLPNVLPLMALLGYLGWFWEAVDTDTLVICLVAIGLGVDDTIHFITRLKFEYAKAGSPDEAVRRTFHYSGRAIVITSIILVIGFAPFALSDYFSVRIFGTLLPYTVVTALAGDIFLVPAMVKLGWIKF